MKRILLFVGLILIIPFLIISFFQPEEKEIEFEFNSNMAVRVKRTSGLIEEVEFERYILGVLAGEMPADFELEALKAQAVAARSYVMVQMQNNHLQDYDVVDTVMNQVYLDEDNLKKRWGDKYIEYINKLKKAVIETFNEYLEYEGEVVEALFFSTSTGQTENSEEIFLEKRAYLRSVSSSWDAAVSPVYKVENSFSLSEFYGKLGLKYKNNLSYEIVDKTSTGRVKKILISGVPFTGHEVQSLLGLRSNFFTLEQVGTNIRVVTQGYGHGVGMSQYGAYGMAKEGYNYEQILKHYYQGVEIKKI